MPDSDEDAANGTGTGGTINFNPETTSIGTPDTPNYWERPASMGLAHELAHARDFATGTEDTGSTGGIPNYEINAVNLTNTILLESDPNATPRTHYGRTPLP